MNPLKVMVIGADPKDMPENDQIMWIVKGEKEVDVTAAENYLMTNKMVSMVDLLVVNFGDRDLSFSDGVIMEMAYSKSTPIFMVAWAYQPPEFFYHMRTQQFTSMEHLIDHLQAHYL